MYNEQWPAKQKSPSLSPSYNIGYHPQADRQKNPRFDQTYLTNNPQRPGAHPENEGGVQPAQSRLARRRKLYVLLVLVLLAGFIYAGFHIVIYGIQTVREQHNEQWVQDLIIKNEVEAAQENQKLTADPGLAATASAAPTATPAVALPLAAGYNDTKAETEKPGMLIQFTNAITENPDTIGQLRVGESINTYVVQRDNAYYLRHSFNGEYSLSGAIFLDVACSIYPQSRNLILHGHNMKNGTSFGKLLRYKDRDYLDQYPVIRFTSLYESAEYLPFAVVYYSIDQKSDDYLSLYQVNYLSDDEFLKFVSIVKSLSIYRLYTNVSKTAKILTLTTCTTEDPNMRFAVFAVKNTP